MMAKVATASASSKGRHLRISIFSGVCKGMEESDSHSFIRVIDGVQAKSRYVDYPYSVFSFRKGLLDITVGKSNFRDNQISLNIKGGSFPVEGGLRYNSLTPWPFRLLSPGTMG